MAVARGRAACLRVALVPMPNLYTNQSDVRHPQAGAGWRWTNRRTAQADVTALCGQVPHAPNSDIGRIGGDWEATNPQARMRAPARSQQHLAWALTTRIS